MDEPAVPLVVTPARAIAVAMDSATDEVLIMRSAPSAGWIHSRTGPGVERPARYGFWVPCRTVVRVDTPDTPRQ